MKIEKSNFVNIYTFAKYFLLSSDQITLSKLEEFLTPNHEKRESLKDIFYNLCLSAQNRQMSTRVIGQSIESVENLRGILLDFNPHLVAKKYNSLEQLKLLGEIISELQPTGKIRDTKKSLWPQYCKSIIDSAHFLSTFENANQFHVWTKNFLSNPNSKPALPLIISTNISGIGFALACDFLKNIGYSEFGKPDVHLKEIFRGCGLIEKQSTLKEDFQTLKVVDLIAEANNVSAFSVDRVFWLIGSGKFEIDGFTINLKRQRSNFIKEYEKHITLQ